MEKRKCEKCGEVENPKMDARLHSSVSDERCPHCGQVPVVAVNFRRRSRHDRAALVYFNRDASRDEIEAMFKAYGHLFSERIVVREYDPNHGHPAFYIP